MLGEGESGRCSGEARPSSLSWWLTDALDETCITSAILSRVVNSIPFKDLMSREKASRSKQAVGQAGFLDFAGTFGQGCVCV